MGKDIQEYVKDIKNEYGLKRIEQARIESPSDPYRRGTPDDWKKVAWFKHLWENYLWQGIHLRAIHYAILPHVKKCHNGAPYRNDRRSWDYLCEVVRTARYLEVIKPEDLTDQRNAPAVPYTDMEGDPQLALEVQTHEWTLAAIPTELPTSLSLYEPQVTGYEYRDCDQPYLLEVWIEKSSMTHVLKPVCMKYGATLVESSGYQSITSFKHLLVRGLERDKPLCIFYISDFDPAGQRMPIQAARQIEFWNWLRSIDLDIQLTPVALKAEQVDYYQLPRNEIKDKDKGKESFEDKFGRGATELDALEGLHPGELARLVEDALEPYWDEALATRLEESERRAQEAIEHAWNIVTHDLQVRRTELLDRLARITQPFEEKLRALEAEREQAIAPLAEEIKVLNHDLKEITTSFVETTDLPARPDSELEPPESKPLLDTDRTYLTQIGAYEAFREDGTLLREELNNEDNRELADYFRYFAGQA